MYMICMSFLPMCMYVHAWSLGGQKRHCGSLYPELELTVVSYYVGVGN